MKNKYNAISLFSGAGGMDLGFQKAEINIVWANEIDKDASKTYELNHKDSNMRNIDILKALPELETFNNIDIIFGGPPCQGFSIAGKMDPTDIRNNLVSTFLEAVNIVRPKAFVMENVKALLTHSKWKDIRNDFIRDASNMGYTCHPILLNSTEFGVPQKRERVFFIGFLNKTMNDEYILDSMNKYKQKPKTIREVISSIGPAGTVQNPMTCTAKITMASKPILRKSPYAGMLFNGAGRPINLDEFSNTLPASMGGNRTPIIDEYSLADKDVINWIEGYHRELIDNKIPPIYKEAPDRLRRLTIKEAATIQTFPSNYIFHGSKSSIYKQIGNAVPVNLAEAVGRFIVNELNNAGNRKTKKQLTFDIF